MQSFLEEVTGGLLKEYDSLEDIIFVLPSKRAGTFLRNTIAKKSKKTTFSPEIYSIESFVERLSGLTYATNIQQLFQLYESYLKITSEEKDNFYGFSKWGQTLLQDFNEIDRYLIDTKKIFSYLSSIQEVNHWYLQKEKTPLIENYIRFWNNLEALYTAFNQDLLNNGLGHQGLVYRTACENLQTYINSSKKKHLFLGFNALNTAEEKIIQEILSSTDADIYWDIDKSFLEDAVHDAGHFIRKHQKNWPYYKNNSIKGLSKNYYGRKNINIVGIPKNISQAKYVGGLLKNMALKTQGTISNTAVVLGDENLMNPIINSVPKTVQTVNITMGYPLGKTPLASMFSQLLKLFSSKTKEGWYYKDVIDILSHPSIQLLLSGSGNNLASNISDAIRKKNWSFIDVKKIESVQQNDTVKLLFFKATNDSKILLDKFLQIILVLKAKFKKSRDLLNLEYLYRFYRLFNELKVLMAKHAFVNDVNALESLYKELISSETLDFQGEPLEGLQVMGMLESRNLDFETVIITSVNEGILPSGKSNNSFIPFDIKKTFGLPTYKEKDAVYTYHFYRLLQRAKNIYLLYNTEPDVLEGGEKSRLIAQLQTDEDRLSDITQTVASPLANANTKILEVVEKDRLLLQNIKTLGENGFSPTSLSNYIRNPIDFYKKNILKISDAEEVEENLAHNTFGTIIHDTLEDLYTPFIGEYLTQEGLVQMKSDIEKQVQKHFTKSFLEGDIGRGKNYIAFHVIVKYIKNFIDLEIEEIKKHEIKILGLEENLNIVLNIPNLSYPVRLKGKLDRIDEIDGKPRIIDYKSGKVEQKNVSITQWGDLIEDYEYSKAFQLLCYSLMYTNDNTAEHLIAGIISFKNLNSGLLKFGKKTEGRSKSVDYTITPTTLDEFKQHLYALITEIFNPDIPLTEKEV
ncbi:PD-(D/E)XK nuclease family protein [Costertonia aggregata]|uniref:PD-(D/E)XK nuclease family protein n=1 Tax=Costertonia aggregata TaxID=343403 RepID=A0A7H9APZ9_9FLAO|nr:PD-(D/E)XK nuclease family protein [Costertonia aggregata]QLG45473.1 PD-(D/E)XK nuclease family protein [Costertonia aggregata]